MKYVMVLGERALGVSGMADATSGVLGWDQTQRRIGAGWPRRQAPPAFGNWERVGDAVLAGPADAAGRG